MKQTFVFNGELIGTFVEVVGSRNSNLIGVSGRIEDETFNLLELNNGKKIVKENAILRINLDNNNFIVDGKLLVGRPEDRIKRRKNE